MPKPSIFISHTHDDQRIADAMQEAVYSLFGRDRVDVVYSTSKDVHTGVRPGEDWYRWIHDTVRDCQVAMILLTPTSITKPWILWEGGAVAGSAYSSAPEGGGIGKIRPIRYQLDDASLPSPFSHIQAVRGDHAEGIEMLFQQFLEDFGSLFSRDDAWRAARRLDVVVQNYLAAIREALRMAPLLANEASVQEWCTRLDNVAYTDRESEIPILHDWLNIAFGHEHGSMAVPIDLRIHRRLGEAYLESESFSEASTQFELARQLWPRDVFILRFLGQAYLGAGDMARAGAVLEDISNLDGAAFHRNAECAALKARWHRERDELQEAERVLREALRHNQRSYYLADVLGQVLLMRGDVEGARSAYARVLEILITVDEDNVWAHASATTALLVLDRHEEAAERMRAIARHRPSAAVLDRIELGLKEVRNSCGYSQADLERWLSVLLSKDSP